jgi:HK97 family phage major capsid protein
MNLQALKTEVATLTNQAKALHAELAQQGDKATAEDKARLGAMIDAGMAKRDELKKLEDLAGLDEYVNEPETAKAQERTSAAWKRWGDMVTTSEQFKQRGHSQGVTVKVGALPQLRKAVYAGTDASGGVAVNPDYRPEIIDIARQRPRSVIDLVNQSQTTSDAVEYVRMTSRTNNAAIVSEFTAGNFGLKPESDIAFDLATATVKTIATWIAASRQILMDAPRLRQMIDTELAYMVEVTLENQVLVGDGVGNNFTGIVNTSGIQSRVHATSGRAFDAADTVADSLRRAITDLYLEFYRPDAIVLHPTQGEELELLKDDTGNYLNIYDSATLRIWRVPVVETPAMTSGTALVGQFGFGATLWDRMQTEIRVGEPNDYFLRNAIAVLAELRAAFAVTRPLAFEKITGL